MASTAENILVLRTLIEDSVNRKIKSPADFSFLSGVIQERTHEILSESTLKRIWGYVDGYDSTRFSTLSILAQCVGYRDWDAFLSAYPNLNQDSSREILSQCLYSDTLSVGDQILIEWQPNRRCHLRHLGGEQFEVLESVNSKLSVFDTFHASVFILHQPLYIDNLRRRNCAPTLFVVGNKGGLTLIQRVQP